MNHLYCQTLYNTDLLEFVYALVATGKRNFVSKYPVKNLQGALRKLRFMKKIPVSGFCPFLTSKINFIAILSS